MKLSVLFISMLLISLLSYGQTNNLVQEDEWFSGMIYDYNNVKKRGYINFNYALNNIKFRSNSSEKIYTTSTISSFDLIINGEKRGFYTMPYKDPKTGKTQKFFFEIIHRNSKYLILSKHQLEFWDPSDTNLSGLSHTSSPFSTKNKHDSSDPFDLFNRDNRKEVVTEILYIANMQLEITPYLFAHKEKQRILNEKKARKKIETGKMISSVLTSDATEYHCVRKVKLQDFFKNDYNLFNQYIESQDIDIRTKEGLLIAIDFTE